MSIRMAGLANVQSNPGLSIFDLKYVEGVVVLAAFSAAMHSILKWFNLCRESHPRIQHYQNKNFPYSILRSSRLFWLVSCVCAQIIVTICMVLLRSIDHGHIP